MENSEQQVNQGDGLDQSPPPVNPPANQRNLLLIIGVIVLIFILASGAYYLGTRKSTTSTPVENTLTPQTTPSLASDETANWKTYTNTKFGYEIGYPTNWYLTGPYGGQAGYECMDNPQNVTIIEFSKTKLTDCGFIAEQLPPAEADVTIWVLNKPFTKDEIPTKNALGEDISTKITIMGEGATKIPFTEKTELPNVQATRIYFNHSGKGYLIFLKQTDKKGDYDPIYDKMLSTFKFTQ